MKDLGYFRKTFLPVLIEKTKKMKLLKINALALLLGILSCVLWTTDVGATDVESSVRAYIAQYQDLAIEESEYSGVPVSIKLAQAIIESRFGTSGLAVQGKNHFGIKCKKDWKGEKVLADDDTPNECFRKYDSVADSFRDHSDFLRYHRLGFYDHLFELDIKDYKAWAVGLQKAGYASTDYYAQSLVFVIEKYELYLFDNSTKGWTNPDFDYSILDKKSPYRGSKKKEKKPDVKIHTVKQGETMEIIAKRYRVNLEQLYTYNKLIWGSQPAVGARLYLNKPAYQPPPLNRVNYKRYRPIYNGKMSWSEDQ